jgi:integrase
MGKTTKDPLTEAEQERLLAAARKMGDFQGVDVEKTILILLDTGIHISVLADPHGHNIRFNVGSNGRKEMRWFRPKKKGSAADTRIILKERIAPWAEDFINSKRPGYTEFYWHMIKKVGVEAGLPKISPMTFRHTFAVNMVRAGFPATVIKDSLNCSEKVLFRYTKYSEEMRDNEFIERGW